MINQIQLLITMTILIIAAINDYLYFKVPNYITFPSIIIGLVLSFYISPTTCLLRIMCIVILFFAGMLNFIGMGDLKLIMAILALNGLYYTAVVVLIGALCLMIYCLVTDYKSMILSLKNTVRFFTLQTPIIPINDEKYPFAFFMALGYPIAFLILNRG